MQLFTILACQREPWIPFTSTYKVVCTNVTAWVVCHVDNQVVSALTDEVGDTFEDLLFPVSKELW